MKAAIITDPGRPPAFADLEAPVPGDGEVLVHVTATALSHVARSRARGGHYSAAGKAATVPGVDGVGRLENGRRVHFFMPGAPGGSMAETVVVDRRRCTQLPDELDDVTAAAIAIPGISSWAALIGRAGFAKGNAVLVNGATGASGRLAIQIAKHLGAGRVVATGRNPDALAALPGLGADAVIPLTDDPQALNSRLEAEFAGGIDIVLDYLWGPPAQAVLVAAARAGDDSLALRYVEIGSLAGAELSLPSAVLRSSTMTLMGSGLGSVPPQTMKQALSDLLAATVPAGLHITTRPVPLAEIASAWDAPEGGERIVFQPGTPG